jgi:putative NADH-flavin reductase
MLKIAIIGANGMLGRPVVHALSKSGLEISALIRNPNHLPSTLLSPSNLIEGTMASREDLKRFLYEQDTLYLNLSVKQSEKETDWHTESEGLELLLPLAREAGVKRIVYLSSLIMNYQNMNRFNWWVFDVKQNAVKMIKESGLMYTIFYPSTFMESIANLYKQGPFLLLAGDSKYKQYFIAAHDYANQVLKSIQNNSSENKEYIIQGPEGFTSDEAIAVFINNYQKGKLFTLKAPLRLIKFYGSFIQKMDYGYHIIEALNNFPEKFDAEISWQELGTPKITLANFAQYQ